MPIEGPEPVESTPRLSDPGTARSSELEPTRVTSSTDEVSEDRFVDPSRRVHARPRRRPAAHSTEPPPPKPAARRLVEKAVWGTKRAVWGATARFLDLVLILSGRTPKSDLETDGARFVVHPKNASVPNPLRPETIYVNGACEAEEMSKADARRLASIVGQDVTLIHNATEARVYPGSQILNWVAMGADLHKDIQQANNDFHDRGTNKAVDTLRAEVLAKMSAGRPVDLVGASQGAIILARALKQAREIRFNQLLEQLGDAQAAREQLRQELARIRVVNVCGSVRQSDFPAELRDENYLHVELPGDPVPKYLGEHSDAYRDEEYAERIKSLSLDLLVNINAHMPENVLRAHAQTVRAFLAVEPAKPGAVSNDAVRIAQPRTEGEGVIKQRSDQRSDQAGIFFSRREEK